jgi:uncharacterized membrane protein
LLLILLLLWVPPWPLGVPRRCTSSRGVAAPILLLWRVPVLLLLLLILLLLVLGLRVAAWRLAIARLCGGVATRGVAICGGWLPITWLL